jgi:tryptophan-rich sensory protein
MDIIEQPFDFNRVGIPPTTMNDILILTSGSVKESGQMLFQRIIMRELWLIYICITIVYILFIASVLSGLTSTWYQNLNKTGVNPYAIGAIWTISIILSYVTIFMIWEHTTSDTLVIDVEISVYFFIGTLLLLLWSTIFFQGNNLGLSVWMIVFLFMYHFWLLVYIWHMNYRAAIFMIPLIIIYGYLFYAMIHLAFINNIGL